MEVESIVNKIMLEKEDVDQITLDIEQVEEEENEKRKEINEKRMELINNYINIG